MKLFLLFSHTIIPTQKSYAKDILRASEFVTLPKELQILFSNVPPELEDLKDYAKPIIEFLNINASKGDYVLIQGDFGLSFLVVEFCKNNNLIPIYATTKRVAYEKDGVKVSRFEFVRFRKY